MVDLQSDNEKINLNSEELDDIKNGMPAEEMLFDLAELFKVFGDSSRIKILYAILQRRMCVTDLATLLQMNQSAVSHQLRILKANGLVKFRRAGKSAIYELADNHVISILSQGMEHVGE